MFSILGKSQLDGRQHVCCCVGEQFGHVSAVIPTVAIRRLWTAGKREQKQQTQVLMRRCKKTHPRFWCIIMTLTSMFQWSAIHAVGTNNIPVHFWAANQTHHPLTMFRTLCLSNRSCQYWPVSLHKSGLTSCRAQFSSVKKMCFTAWGMQCHSDEIYWLSATRHATFCGLVPWKCNCTYTLDIVIVWTWILVIIRFFNMSILSNRN